MKQIPFWVDDHPHPEGLTSELPDETDYLIVGSGLFMFGSMMAVIAFGWGLGKAAVRAQVALGVGKRTISLVTFWIRWVVPPVLLAILAGGALSALGVF